MMNFPVQSHEKLRNIYPCLDKRDLIVFLGSETNTKLLLENGADVNAQGRRGKTPLHKARTNGIVDTLLENGANPYAKITTKDAPITTKDSPPNGPRMFTVGNCFQNICVQCTLCTVKSNESIEFAVFRILQERRKTTGFLVGSPHDIYTPLPLGHRS